MSQGFDEPLAELYAYNLYANENSFSRKFYLIDLKKSEYYHKLLKELQIYYPNTKYFEQYKKELTQDYTPYLQKKTTKLAYISYVLGVLLLLSLGFNFSFLKSRFRKKTIDYKTILSQQEQKVFVLMNEKFSNKEIAESLFISVSTVKSHINMIYSKLSINSRKEVNRFFK
jgi:DNA-binding CsgD family transcriptional regulator